MPITVSRYNQDAEIWYEKSCEILDKYEEIRFINSEALMVLRVIGAMNLHFYTNNFDECYDRALIKLSEVGDVEIPALIEKLKPGYDMLRYVHDKYGPEILNRYVGVFFSAR